mmetsp:Transcript_37401/g.120462  ORF Transcript_37401/g.120462 Transcript_37401/m.120462 type:complete len:211 (+) Transcript_37401:804-1436(+)
MQRIVVELVHEVRLQGEGLAVNGVFRGRVPMHLVEVVFRATNDGVAFRATDAVHFRDFVCHAAVVVVRAWGRLEELEAMACVFHIRSNGVDLSLDHRNRCLHGILRHDVDGRLLLAADTEPPPSRRLCSTVGSGLAGIRIDPTTGCAGRRHLEQHEGQTAHGDEGRNGRAGQRQAMNKTLSEGLELAEPVHRQGQLEGLDLFQRRGASSC